MEEMMSRAMGEEDVDRDGTLPVFASSVSMFVYVKSSVKRCTALTTGQTFFNLQKAFKECLGNYGACALALVWLPFRASAQSADQIAAHTTRVRATYSDASARQISGAATLGLGERCECRRCVVRR